MDSDFISEYGFIIVAAIVGVIVIGFVAGAIKDGGLFSALIEAHDAEIGG